MRCGTLGFSGSPVLDGDGNMKILASGEIVASKELCRSSSLRMGNRPTAVAHALERASTFSLPQNASEQRPAVETVAWVFSGRCSMKSLLSLLTAFFVTATSPVFAQSIGAGAQVKENLDLPYDAIGDNTDEEEDAPEIIQFYGQTYEGDGIFYCIDRSGSMQGSGELDIAKREVTRNISEFSDRVEFGIVFFDSKVLKWPPSGQPAPANASKKQSGISWVQTMPGGSGSAISKGLTAALDMVNKSTKKRLTLIYVGDGGGSQPSMIGQIKGRNTKRAIINTIGVLDVSPTNRDFLKQLAQSNNGKYTEIVR